MFCRTCGQRETCVAICSRLAERLREEEHYQRERTYAPDVLEAVADRSGRSWPELVPESPWVWGLIGPCLIKLPAPVLSPFLLHYYDGMTVTEIARYLHIHRVTVNRRLRRAVAILKREMGGRIKGEG